MGRSSTPRHAAPSNETPSAVPARSNRGSRARRVGLALAGVLLGLVVSAAVTLWRLSDVEGALDAAAARLAASTALELTHGPVGVSVGRRLGVSVQDVKLVDRHTERTLFDASSLIIALELAPLAHGSVELRDIVVARPRVFGRRAADGTIDLIEAVDRVVAAAKAQRPAEPSRRRAFVSHIAADRIEIHGARLDWLDELHPRGTERAVLEPVDVTVSRHGDTHTLTVAARATLAEPRPHGDDGLAPVTTLSVNGSLGGLGTAATIAEATWDVEVAAAGVDAMLIEPWLTPSLGPGSALAGRARLEAHVRGSWAEGLGGRAQVVVDDVRVALPSAWGEPQRFRRIELDARVARRAQRWSLDDGRIDTGDVTLAVRGAIDGPGGSDPAVEMEVTSPWLDLARVRHRVPTRALGRVFAYFARVIEEGQGRIDRLAARGRVSQFAALGDPANRDVLSGRFSFSRVAGTPHAGLDRMSAIAGTLALERGDLALVCFTGRSGSSDLGRVTGEIRELWGTTRSEIRTEGADVALADVPRLLASDLFPAAARAVAGDLEVSDGRARARTTLVIQQRRPIHFSGDATLVGGALTLGSRDVHVTELAGPLSFSGRELASGGLAFRLGGSSPMRVAGSVADYAGQPVLSIAVEGRGLPVADVERLLVPQHGAAPGGGGRVSGSVRLEGRVGVSPSVLRSAALTLERVDVWPPLVAQALEDVTGDVAVDSDGVRFDASSLTWRGHRVAASGRVTGLGGRSPRVEVVGRALEPLDIGRVTGAPASTSRTAPPIRPTPHATAADDDGLVVEGHYRADQARLRDTPIRDLAVAFRFHGDTLLLERVTGAALDGTFDTRASVRFDGGRPIDIGVVPKLEGVTASGLSALLDLPWKKVTGHADLAGEVRFAWPPKEHLDSLAGHLEVTLRDGRIHEAVGLWKVLDLVDFSSWIRRPMGWRELGLAYDELHGRVEFGASRVVTRDFSLSGPTVDLALDGTIGLADRSIDALVTVSPLQLVDQLVDPIPVVGPVKRALDLTSYSFRLQGTLGSVRVTPATLDRVDDLLEQAVPGGNGRDAELRAP
ncbi:MAG: hypothetical protein IPK07_27615 [Deltaproteobacteria bacterium]|nr:hypothetical protein [Deltaproteobacteria bacterium]